MRNKPIPFSSFRALLNGLGYADKRSEKAWIFHHGQEGLLVFRLYGDDEPVDERDLVTTRKFLDLRGLLDAGHFDAALHQTAPA